MDAQNVDPDGMPYTGALVVLIPAADDPIVVASSEPAHLTFVWFGDNNEMQSRDTPESPQIDIDTLKQEVQQYASELDGPLTVPVSQLGTLGDDEAYVAFLEPTDSLLAMRDGLLANEQVGSAHDAVEQFPDYTPHVTLGYPETPPNADYAGDSVTFDRIGLWLGGEAFDYPMGGTVSDTVTAAAAAPADAAPDVQVDPADAADMVDEEPEPDAIPQDADVPDPTVIPDEIPIHGVLAVEGIETGDGRGFRPDALSTRPLPLTYRYEAVGSHGGNGTSEVYDVGRIDDAWRDDATGEWRFEGAIVLNLPYALEAVDTLMAGVKTGLSIDADMMADDVETYTQEYVDEAMSNGKMPTQWLKQTRISGATQVPIPAFSQSYTGIGDRSAFDAKQDDTITAAAVSPEVIAQQLGQAALIPDDRAAGTAAFKRGPGWVKAPVATNRIHDYWTKPGKPGFAKIAWGTPGDFARAKTYLSKYISPAYLNATVAQWHHDAVGYWPATHAKRVREGLVAAGGIPAPIVTLRADAGAGRTVYPAEWFADPKFSGVSAQHIDRETGRVYGHLAQWNSCHIGIQGACVKPPHSASGYANFLHGVVDTDQGEVAVGTLTYGIGHANPAMRAAAATAHYDQTDAVYAYVAVGEDAYGIWYSGVLRPGTSQETIDDVRAIGSLSGDWRRFSRFGLDLVAAVSVNTPGYSLAASGTMEWEGQGDMQMSAIGLGMVDPEEEQSGETHDQFVARVAGQVAAKFARDERAAKLHTRARAYRLSDARARAAGLKEMN